MSEYGLKVVHRFRNGVLRVSTTCTNDTENYIGAEQMDRNESDVNQFMVDGQYLFWVMEKGKEVALADIGLAYYPTDHCFQPYTCSWLMAVDQKPAPISVWIKIVKELIKKSNNWPAILLLGSPDSDLNHLVWNIKVVRRSNVDLIHRLAEHIKANFKKWVEETSSIVDEDPERGSSEDNRLPDSAYSILLPKAEVDKILAERRAEEDQRGATEEDRKAVREKYLRENEEHVRLENEEMGLDPDAGLEGEGDEGSMAFGKP